MKRIGMLTSGGDCQALNAAMRGVVITGLTRNQLAGQPARGFESRRLRYIQQFGKAKLLYI